MKSTLIYIGNDCFVMSDCVAGLVATGPDSGSVILKSGGHLPVPSHYIAVLRDILDAMDDVNASTQVYLAEKGQNSLEFGAMVSPGEPRSP